MIKDKDIKLATEKVNHELQFLKINMHIISTLVRVLFGYPCPYGRNLQYGNIPFYWSRRRIS